MVFFTEKGDLIQPVTGYHLVRKSGIYLEMVATDDYKKITTAEAWQDYQEGFKGTFEE